MLHDIPPYAASAAKLTLTEALIKLLQRPRWQRVSALQEFLLAKEVVLLCDSRAVEWQHLETILDVLVRQARRAAKHGNGELRPSTQLNFELLGKICASVAKAFLASTARLDVLTDRPARPRYLSQSEPYNEKLLLPSWVPDWTQDTARFLSNSISATQFSSYNALQKFVSDQQSFNADLGGDCQSCFKFTDNDEILHLRGAMAKKIVSIGDPLDLALASLAHYSLGDHSVTRAWKEALEQFSSIQLITVFGIEGPWFSSRP
ncbi:hypothetical protein X797_011694 [Metarhizium robertsii]|uniref:Uncharacterized protein n=1 Tax=Metarhizium robertsii TaxID=568076 RepID=A0A014PI41_9HYPO|nr:hypothetical protein X797_011694 [Metarhizium robertsii]